MSGKGGPTTAPTCSVTVSLFVPAVAAIFASPDATAVTKPVPFTVATLAGVAPQVKDVFGIGVWAASYAVAVYCWVPPTVIVAPTGVTVTDATSGVGGVTVPELSSLQVPKVRGSFCQLKVFVVAL